MELNTVGLKSSYPRYLESFKEENLSGSIESLKKYELSNMNYHENSNQVLFSDTVGIAYWFELNEAQELITVSSPKGKDNLQWKLIFKDKKEIEGWRFKNGSLSLDETYIYNKLGLPETRKSNTYGYDEITTCYYDGIVPIKRVTSSQGIKNVEEWIQKDDSTFYILNYKILSDNKKVFNSSTKFKITNKKIAETRFNTKDGQPKDGFSLTHSFFERVSIINELGQVIEEKIIFEYDTPSTIVHKYRYDTNGRTVYHEQFEVEKKERSVWETIYDNKGKDIQSTGATYSNGNLLYTTKNINSYDAFGNILTENQSGEIHRIEYKYDSKNNWTTKKYFINDKLLKIEFRIIKYFE
jgi:hypothetical protein